MATKQRLEEVNEPFDPAYLSDKGYEAPEISASEQKYLRKISILQNKLRRAGIKYEWDNRGQVFMVWKYRKTGNVVSEYPTIMYLAVYDDGKYAFGGEETDLVVDGKVSIVVAAAKEWLSNNKPAVK